MLTSLIALSGSAGQPSVVVYPEPKVEVAAVKTVDNDQTTIPELISQYSRQYGVNSREAQAIAFCESTNRHFDHTGQVLRGKVNARDVGLFQINEYYHLDQSQKLGYDIYTLEGNIGYAMWLMSQQGNRPWFWSRSCWTRQLAAGH